MYIRNLTTNDEKKNFLAYMYEVLRRMEITPLSKTTRVSCYKGEFRHINCTNYATKETFKNMDEIALYRRSSIEYEKKAGKVETLPDGRIVIHGFLTIPTNDIKSDNTINSVPDFILAYLNYPYIRQCAPDIPGQYINPELQEYQTRSAFGYLLGSYEGLEFMRRDFELKYKKEQEMEQN